MKRQDTVEFWEGLVSLREGATMALLSVFSVGVLVMGLVSNLTYGLLTDADGLGWNVVLRVTLVSALMLLGAYWVYRQERRNLNRLQVIVDESSLAEPHRGLIWLLGPGGVEHARAAIRHHAGGPAGHRLEYVWLVMQAGNASVQAAWTTLQARVAEDKLAVRWEPVWVERLDVEAAYRAVQRVFEQLAPAVGLTENEVCADITGATKPMTMGMILAALDRARDLEYVESQRDDAGEPLPGTQRVVWVNKAFRLERSRPRGA